VPYLQAANATIVPHDAMASERAYLPPRAPNQDVLGGFVTFATCARKFASAEDVDAPAPIRDDAASWSFIAALLTVARRTPSITDKNSCVSEKISRCTR